MHSLPVFTHFYRRQRYRHCPCAFFEGRGATEAGEGGRNADDLLSVVVSAGIACIAMYVPYTVYTATKNCSGAHDDCRTVEKNSPRGPAIRRQETSGHFRLAISSFRNDRDNVRVRTFEDRCAMYKMQQSYLVSTEYSLI